MHEGSIQDLIILGSAKIETKRKDPWAMGYGSWANRFGEWQELS